MASSSSPHARSIVSSKLYDAFISHRGPDVKDTLGLQLYKLLDERGLEPFLDREEIKPGDSITAAIRNAICSSRVQIAIFSIGFAESPWCLDELDSMLKESDTLFIPVFYGVEPWELRHIDNDKSQYAKAFVDYQSKGRNLDNLDGWKRALKSAAGISGYVLEVGQHPEDSLQNIVSHVVKFVKDKEKFTPFGVATYPVGLVELVQHFESCCPQKEGIVGISGLGGSGKTTLAKELFNKKSSGYHKSSFLSDVRKSAGKLYKLQRRLLKNLFDIEDESISSVHDGTGRLMECLERGRHLRFLIVMDDIDHLDQLNALLPEVMRGIGSLVIITTRNQRVLRGVDAHYKMKEMDGRHAEDLFCEHAFRGGDRPTAYQTLVTSFVKYCAGLPLSLVVLGAHLYDRKEKDWKLELEKVKKILHPDIKKILKISFDGLEEDEKQIFIDIACIFNKKYAADYNLTEKAISIWKACGWSAELAVQTLKDKCLIEMGGYEFEFKMHDHLRDLGRQMAKELGPPRLWQRELLRSMKAKGFQQTLADTKGTCFHSFKDSSLDRKITYFMADSNLVFLEIEGGVNKLDNIPSWIPLQKLQHLSIYRVEDLWSSFKKQLETHVQATSELRTLHIVKSPSLPKLPNLGEMFSHLEELFIVRSLQKTDTISLVQSLKQLRKLRSLCLVGSKGGLFKRNLDLGKDRNSSTRSRMNSLEIIQLGDFQNIFKLIISKNMCPKLQTLDIRGMDNLKMIKLKSFMKVADRSPLQKIFIIDCPKLQSVQGVEELAGLAGLVIEVVDNRNGWVDKYIGGLTRLPAKQTILLQEANALPSVKLNLNLFSEMMDTEAVSQFQKGPFPPLEMESSLNAIAIYVLHGMASPAGPARLIYGNDIFYPHTNFILTVVLTQHDCECRLDTSIVWKGYKAIFKIGEEGKALMILQRIVDQLYMG